MLFTGPQPNSGLSTNISQASGKMVSRFARLPLSIVASIRVHIFSDKYEKTKPAPMATTTMAAFRSRDTEEPERNMKANRPAATATKLPRDPVSTIASSMMPNSGHARMPGRSTLFSISKVRPIKAIRPMPNVRPNLFGF